MTDVAGDRRAEGGRGQARDPNLDDEVGEAETALDELGEKLAAFNVLRRSDEAAADAILEQLAGTGRVEQEMMSQLAAPRPIARPERFEAAHRAVMKSFEVLKRNGSRPPRLPSNLGPLRPVAAWVVQLFARFIIQNQLTRLVDNVRHLYGRRESWSLPGSPEAAMLRRAQWQAERLAPGYKGRALGLPGFLLGGAFLTTILGGVQTASRTVHDSFTFALVSLVGMAIVWVVIPIGIVLAIRG